MSQVMDAVNEERREVQRKRALKKGVIAYNDRYCSAECTVRNETKAGAMLVLSQNHLIPATFEIKILPERDFRIAEAIWRTPDAMGIRFVQPDNAIPRQNGWNGVERRAQGDRRRGDRRSS